jgi:maleylacetate reductase
MQASARFVHQQRQIRVVFETGSVDTIAEEVDRLECRRVVLIAGRRYAPQLSALLGARVVDGVDRPTMHVPVEQVDDLEARAIAFDADGAVAVGGGSAIGLAKALALRSKIPVIAVPTTFSGSEMTRVWGITTAAVKSTGRDEVVAPKTVLYDPDLIATLPAHIAVPSAFNAVAHAVEALYAPDRTPITKLYATEGISALITAIPQLAEGSPRASGTALYGAFLCGLCLDCTSMSLHHKLCHALGGALGLPHAQTHTAVLPHALDFNAPAVPDGMAILRDVLGVDEPANFFRDLAKSNGATMALFDLGMRLEDIGPVADLCWARPPSIPGRSPGGRRRASAKGTHRCTGDHTPQ